MNEDQNKLSLAVPKTDTSNLETLTQEENTCEKCDAKCCKYFALPIDKPENYEQFDFVRWFLLHRGVSVFIDDGIWYLLVESPCQYLDANYRCSIYEKRPLICRAYSNKKCEFRNKELYEYYFDHPDQIEEYAESVLGPRTGKYKF